MKIDRKSSKFSLFSCPFISLFYFSALFSGFFPSDLLAIPVKPSLAKSNIPEVPKFLTETEAEGSDPLPQSIPPKESAPLLIKSTDTVRIPTILQKDGKAPQTPPTSHPEGKQRPTRNLERQEDPEFVH